MRNGGGFLLVLVGILLLWMAITGRLDCLAAFASCLANGSGSTSASGSTLPSLETFGNVMKIPGTTTDPYYGAVSPGGRTSVWGPGGGAYINDLPRNVVIK